METIIEISKSHHRPEIMRVIHDHGEFKVQTYSEKQGRYITQKSHAKRIDAIDDCINWYQEEMV